MPGISKYVNKSRRRNISRLNTLFDASLRRPGIGSSDTSTHNPKTGRSGAAETSNHTIYTTTTMSRGRLSSSVQNHAGHEKWQGLRLVLACVCILVATTR